MKATSAAYMQNRELSWLKFNERVLHEANRQETPLLERLKFVAIFTSNLDEFFRVRVGALINYAHFDEDYRDSKTGKTAREQLDEIYRATAQLYVLRNETFSSIMEELSLHGVQLVKMHELSAEELKKMKKHFTYNILPLLSPQVINSRHPFPHLSNTQLHIAVTLESKKKFQFGLIAMPSEVERVIPLDISAGRFVLAEDIVWHFAELVFSTYKVSEKNIVVVTRNADIDTEEFLDEDIDYRIHMENVLKKRRRLSPVRLEMAHEAGDEMQEFFCKKLSLSVPQIFYSDAPLNMSFCFSLAGYMERATARKLSWPSHVPAEVLPSAQKVNIVKTLSAGNDLLFSYPFDSMSPFLYIIRQSAEDSAVVSIKITLYRIDAHSTLAESLISAAENGKEVTVVMELRARFDEQNNIEWAQRFEEAGCRVIYGPENYKVHSKVCIVTRKEFGKIKFITMIGTGNFNEKTAKLYTDLLLITANHEIGCDASDFFGNLLTANLHGSYQHLWVAPSNFKSNVLECIEAERQKSLNGGQGRVIIKCNSLTDTDIIEALAQASRGGVKIFMIVRGICCIMPRLADTENIRVISIVGKFLEHSRIFCFGSGATSKIYISSADFMTRNTERRVEVACPILCPELKKRVRKMLDTMLKDNTQAWELFSENRYVLRQPPDAEAAINSQKTFTEEARTTAIEARNGKSKNGNGKFSIAARIKKVAEKFLR
ncbi:MAG: polyphosphate kinase 1 [Defluviitaleaceae bacterium]|nr:polyphosphate kinase 1 [Defluviitaleaceae bacterium]MCL2262203.1 polyphosphate kinase 1 [Defluviitaleaceae bacterium]